MAATKKEGREWAALPNPSAHAEASGSGARHNDLPLILVVQGLKEMDGRWGKPDVPESIHEEILRDTREGGRKIEE